MFDDPLLREHLVGRNFVVLSTNLGPYHVARMRALGQRLSMYKARLVVVELAGLEKSYRWRVDRAANGFEWRTLSKEQAVEDVPARLQRRLMRECLAELRPVVTLVSGWSRPFFRAALDWCRGGPGICLIVSSSTATTRRNDSHTKRRVWPFELYKRWLLRGVDGALVPGNAGRQYLNSLGVPRDRIFLKIDAVDNDYIAKRAAEARRDAARLRAEYGVPEQFFVCPARLLPLKNHVGMLRAYEKYLKRAANAAWGLVMLGEGAAAPEVDAAMARLNCPKVVRRAFSPLEVVADHYGLASALVLASFKETWGLVLNEAAAAGLPLLVSNRAHAAEHLIQPGVNGWCFDPDDPDELAELFWRLSTLPAEELEQMGAASRRIVADWGLEQYLDEALRAVATAMRARGWAQPQGGRAMEPARSSEA
jgi:1,2-diacylglycerol 3-alpha-glucosyltransferase